MSGGGGDNLIPLAKGSVLYLGSAVPLETSVGLEALQAPLRDRYLTSDPYQKVSGIDAVLTVFSSGIIMQYPGDDSSSTWFPMQTLHMCAAVKAVAGMGGSTFVSVDSPQALASRDPPIFAVIMRRSRGVKVLECHVFVCKSTDAALGFVQSCTHAFQHREGWMNGLPGSGSFGASAARIVAADSVSGMVDLPRTPLQGFLYSQDQRAQMYNVSGIEPPRPAPAPVVQAPAPVPAPAPAPAPAPPPPVQVVQQPTPSIQVVQQPTPSVPQVQYIAMNPPGAPVAQPVPQMMIPQGYFADWEQNYGMTYMVVPESPLYPGDDVYNREKKKRSKKKKNKKKKKSKSKKHEEEEEEDGGSDEDEEEFYYVRRSKQNHGQDDVGVPAQSSVQPQQEVRFAQPPSEVRYAPEPVRQPQQQQQQQQQPPTTEIHYIPYPKSSQPFPPMDLPPDMIERTFADVYLAKMPPKGGGGGAGGGGDYYYDDRDPRAPQFPGGGGPGGAFDPYGYRVQLQDPDYDYRREYEAARQQQGQQGRQGIYDMKLPRTNFEYSYDPRAGFDGMANSLGYIP